MKNLKLFSSLRPPMASRFTTRVFLLVTLASTIAHLPMSAQEFLKDSYGVPVTANGAVLDHPFSGGLYNPMHQFADIDLDGDLDLFIYELIDGTMTFYRNTGTPSTPVFHFEHDPFPIPPVFGWFRLEDINGDNLLDVATSTLSGNTLTIYLHTGSAIDPQFTLLTEALLDSAGVLVYAESFSICDFADIDADGDEDFFSLNSNFGTINFYENIGSTTSMILAFRTDRWQDIQICVGCGNRGEQNERHGNGTMYFGDIDNDLDFDMLYGDLFDPGLFFFQNIGTPQIAIMDSITAQFPPKDPVITGGFNQPTLADIDNDGYADLFVSVLFPLERVNNFRLYANDPTPPDSFNFQLVTRNYLETLDFGLQSAPEFADIDADGDQDLFIGDLDGHVAFVKNTGTVMEPAFVLEDSFFISSITSYTYTPQLADIDGDLDLDLFLGHFSGKIEFYRNNGTPLEGLFERALWIFDTLSVGNYAAPAFFDEDGDNDLDLFVGRALGTITLYRNQGTPGIPSFALESASYLGESVGTNSKPEFFDEDGDGDDDLLVGASDGTLRLYRNEGTQGNPIFLEITTSYAGIDSVREAKPAVADLDGDGDLDLLMGNYRGGIEFYRNPLLTSSPEDNPLPGIVDLRQNYPNPFNPRTSIDYNLPSSAFVTLKVYDLLGREIATLVQQRQGPGEHRVMFDGSLLPSGVYLCQLQAGSSFAVRKIVLLK